MIEQYALSILARPAEEGSGNVIFGQQWLLDNIFAVGGVIGAVVAVGMLARANRSQNGENLVTFGNVCVAALTGTAFTVLIVAAPALLAKLLPGMG